MALETEKTARTVRLELKLTEDELAELDEVVEQANRELPTSGSRQGIARALFMIGLRSKLDDARNTKKVRKVR